MRRRKEYMFHNSQHGGGDTEKQVDRKILRPIGLVHIQPIARICIIAVMLCVRPCVWGVYAQAFDDRPYVACMSLTCPLHGVAFV
jgi:hypothetical protein